MRKTISQREIATMLDVNVSTVSRAINGQPGVSEDLRQKIVQLARQATLHLIDTGARRVAFLGGPNSIKQAVDRKHGYLEAFRERGVPIRKELVKCGLVSFNSGLSDTLELLSLPEPPDAILADHGLLSIAAFQAVIGKGLQIPSDVSVVGFMSDWVSGMSYPRMTFVKQNKKEIGCKAFKLLLDQINGNDSVKHLVVSARLNIRESTTIHKN
jgi:LacI family transcriptional regulator